MKVLKKRGTHEISLHYYSVYVKSHSINVMKRKVPTSLGGEVTEQLIKILINLLKYGRIYA